MHACTQGDAMNIWKDVNPARVMPHDFLAVIEIPKGCKNKYELDKERVCQNWHILFSVKYIKSIALKCLFYTCFKLFPCFIT